MGAEGATTEFLGVNEPEEGVLFRRNLLGGAVWDGEVTSASKVEVNSEVNCSKVLRD